MKRGTTIVMACLMIGTMFMGMNGFVGEVRAASIWIVDQGGNGDFLTITAAIADASVLDGDTIYVWDGTYNENVVVNKSLSIIGNGSASTIIDGGGTGTVMSVTSSWTNITGFNVTGSGSGNGKAGIKLVDVQNCLIGNNIVWNNSEGFRLSSSSGNIVSNSIVSNNNHGIFIILSSDNNIIQNNTISNNNWYGILLESSSGNIIQNNTISNHNRGIYNNILASDNNIVNCTILNSANHDVYLTSDSNAKLLNTTFDKNKVGFGVGLSTLKVQWYLHILVTNSMSQPLLGAEVEIYNGTGYLIGKTTTSSDGYSRWNIGTEYVESNSGRVYCTPHIVSSRYGSYINSTNLLIDETKEITLILNNLQPPVIDVSVVTGLQYDNTNVDYDVVASVSVDGKAHSHNADTLITITIYDDDMNKIVDNDLMNILDANLGLYAYSNLTTAPGVYFVVVSANIAGTVQVGMTSFEVVEWIQDIKNINATVTEINAKLRVFWDDFNFTWSNWDGKFSTYWAYFNTTIDGLNQTLQDRITGLAGQMQGFETNITTILANLAGNVSQIDQNLTNQDNSMQSYFSYMWNEHNDTQTLVGLYWSDWNTTMTQLQGDLNYINLTTTAINMSLTSFQNQFLTFWDQFNTTSFVSQITQMNDWFNTTWDMMGDFETNVSNLFYDQNVNISRVDQNITTLDNAVQAGFQSMYDNHTLTRDLISNYWSGFNITIAAMQTDVDFLNSTLQQVVTDLSWANNTLNALYLMTQTFWDDFNSTWSSWDGKFSTYWAYFNTTLDGMNQTLQDRIAGVAGQMGLFETNITMILANLAGNVSQIDQNLTSMDNLMQIYFSSMWNEHNDTQALVGLYWNDWNTTMAQIRGDLNYINLTTTAINMSLTGFQGHFLTFWDQYNTTSAEQTAQMNDWFNTTWSRMGDLEANVTTMLNDQNVNISRIDQNITAIDNQMQAGFQSMYDNHTLTRSLISSYWDAWNTTIAAVRADIDFINSTMIQITYDIAWLNTSISALQADMDYLNATLTAMLNDLSVHLANVNGSIMNQLESLEANISSRLDGMNTTFLAELAKVNLTLYNEIQTLLTMITGDIAGMNSSLSSQLASLSNNIAADHDSLRIWLELVLNRLTNNLTMANQTLHAHLTDLEILTTDFYNTLLSDLGTVKAMLMMSENNLTAELDLLDDTILSAHDLTLSQLSARITALAANLSAHDTAISGELLDINADILSFESNTNIKLAEINETLGDLEKLNDILDKLNELDASFHKANNELARTLETTSDDEMSKMDLQTVLLLLILILLVISIILNLMGRKKGRAKVSSPKTEEGEPELEGAEISSEESIATAEQEEPKS